MFFLSTLRLVRGKIKTMSAIDVSLPITKHKVLFVLTLL